MRKRILSKEERQKLKDIIINTPQDIRAGWDMVALISITYKEILNLSDDEINTLKLYGEHGEDEDTIYVFVTDKQHVCLPTDKSHCGKYSLTAITARETPDCDIDKLVEEYINFIEELINVTFTPHQLMCISGKLIERSVNDEGGES